MARTKKLHRFYTSKAWIDLREHMINERIARDGVLICEHCKQIISKSREAIGHHKVELTEDNVDDINISLNPVLIEIICFTCHNKDHKRFGYGKKSVYIVYGPPLSGKTTYVMQHKTRGDIVLDMDSLFEAITMLPRYDKPNHLLSNVSGVYDLLLDNIKTRYGKWHNAWIIGGYADSYKRNRIINDLGAEPILISATREQCYERLLEDTQRGEEWKGYIDKWFDSYVE